MKKGVLALALSMAISLTYASTEPVLAMSSNGNFCIKVPVLMYHHIQPTALSIAKKQTSLSVDTEMFEKQMKYLSQKGYQAINAKELIDALIHNTPLSQKSVVVTLDDGYADAYVYAYPIAQKYGIKLNLMISTGLLNNSDYLSWDQLKAMVASGGVYAHNHTWSHANLVAASPVKREFEIETAAKQLKENLGISRDVFAYPYGSNNNVVQVLLKQKGYTGAFSTVYGINECSANIMALPRIRVGNLALSRYGI